MAVEATYCTIAEVDTFVNDNGRGSEWLPFTDAQKKQAVLESTRDIEMYHRQWNIDDTLWLPDEENFEKACVLQSLYVINHQSFRDISNRINATADGRYSAGGVSVSGGAKRILEPPAKLLVQRTLQRWGVRQNAFYRA